MHLLILLAVGIGSTSAGTLFYPLYSKTLECGKRMYGSDFKDHQVNFAQPLKPGQILFVNGTVSHAAGGIGNNLYVTSPTAEVALHVRQELPSTSMVYDSFQNGGWVKQLFGTPMVYFGGKDYQLAIEYTGSSFKVYSGSTLIFTFPMRTKSTDQLGGFSTNGPQTLKWIEIRCDGKGIVADPVKPVEEDCEE